jgi:hypothetical protein
LENDNKFEDNLSDVSCEDILGLVSSFNKSIINNEEGNNIQRNHKDKKES